MDRFTLTVFTKDTVKAFDMQKFVDAAPSAIVGMSPGIVDATIAVGAGTRT